MDIDSESDNKYVQQPASSSNFEISQLQDIANGLDQVYDSTEERKVEIKIEEKREEKILKTKRKHRTLKRLLLMCPTFQTPTQMLLS